jgi:hypothetical protein
MGRVHLSPLRLARRAVRDRTALAVACLALVVGVVLMLPLFTTVFLVVAGWASEVLIRSLLEGLISVEPRARVNPSGPEAEWLLRSERAVRAISRLAQSAPKGPVADRCRNIAANAALSIAEIRRIAGRASQIGDMVERIDANRLATEAARLEADLAAAGTALVTGELKRAMESVSAQQAVHERLSAAAAAALARVQSASMGLDGLVARMAEIVALADEGAPAAGMAADHLGELALEMEALRAGLADSTANLEVTQG